MKTIMNWRFGLPLAALALFAALYTLNFPTGKTVNAQEKAPAQGDMVPDVKALNAQGELPDIVLGKKDAPFTIIEYSSLTCPHCAKFHANVLPALKSKYIKTGKVRYILREFPLDNLAVAGFMLARCKSDKYYDIVEDLYANQDEWAFVKNPIEKLKARVKKMGYTDESFQACLRDQTLLDKIVKVRDKASKQFKVQSTPTIFVNGQLLKGASHIAQIEELMAKKAK